MGGMFGGGGTISTSEPMIGSLRVQTSAYGMAVPIVYGRTRVPANMIWYGDFQPIAHTSTQSAGGKGGGTQMSNTTYTYRTALAMGLCEGPVNDVVGVWVGKSQSSGSDMPAQTLTIQNERNTVPGSAPYKVSVANAANFVQARGVTYADGRAMTDVSPAAPAAAGQFQRVNGDYTFSAGDAGQVVLISYDYSVPAYTETALSALGLSLFTGTVPQDPWGYLTTMHPAEAVGYPGLAYVASGSYDLGNSDSLDNHNFEVEALLPFSADIRDSNPSDVLLDLLTAERYGAGFPAASLGSLTNYSNWCVANGLFVSPVYSEQRQAHECITELLDATCAALVYSEGRFKIIPYGDTAVTGNGASYVPDLTPQYDLDDDCFLGNDDPIKVTRSPNADAFNSVQVEFANRANQYNLQVEEAKDQADIEAFGLRPEDPQKWHMFTEQSAAQVSAQLRLQRKLYIRNTYAFKLGWQFARLEPMDIVTLTDPGLGLVRTPVRVVEIEEDESGELSVTAEELPIGAISATARTSQAPGGFGSFGDQQPGPVVAPIIFEPPLALTGGDNEVWVAVAGASAGWAGANLWVSLDGSTYERIGTILGAARYGVLHAALPAPAGDPDTQNNCVVDLNTDGQLLSGAQVDVDASTTLCYVDGEILAYKVATLSAHRSYTLSYLRRGLYGSPVGAHAAGAGFARLDQAIFKYPLSSSLIGRMLYLKLTSFDAFGGNEQNLAEVSAYSYLARGGRPSGPAMLALTSPFVGTSFSAQWSAVSGATSYQVEVWSGGVRRRAVSVTSTSFDYTLEDATADGGPWRDFTLKVAAVASSQTSSFTQISFSNPEPAAPTGISTSATASAITVNWSAVSDVDLQDYAVWISSQNGFDPNSIGARYVGTALTTTVDGFTTNTTYYVRVAARDKWGAGSLNYSQQFSITTA